MSEKILGIIMGRRLRGGILYALYFTSSRLIAAKTVNTTLWGFLWPIGDHIALNKAKKRSEELKKLSFESILKADKKNFEIPYAEITKVEMKKARVLSVPEISIFTHTQKYEFVIWEKKEFDAHESLVRSVLPDKLSISLKAPLT